MVNCSYAHVFVVKEYNRLCNPNEMEFYENRIETIKIQLELQIDIIYSAQKFIFPWKVKQNVKDKFIRFFEIKISSYKIPKIKFDVRWKRTVVEIIILRLVHGNASY